MAGKRSSAEGIDVEALFARARFSALPLGLVWKWWVDRRQLELALCAGDDGEVGFVATLRKSGAPTHIEVPDVKTWSDVQYLVEWVLTGKRERPPAS